MSNADFPTTRFYAVSADAPITTPVNGYNHHRAVTRSRKRTSHGLHLVLSVVTGGAWAVLVWAPITLWHKFGPRARTVTRYR
jgi:hypothetical protein